jgi:hypothetical protein
MVSAGEKARMGLARPSSRRIERGGPITAAFGVWGALTARAGVVAGRAEELEGELAAFFPRFAASYYEAVAAWYEALAVGRPAGEVVAAVAAATPADLWVPALNPGHLIHTDEWLSTPFTEGSAIPLVSGMAIQMDIIPLSRGPFCVANAEDGIVLADEALRADLASHSHTIPTSGRVSTPAIASCAIPSASASAPRCFRSATRRASTPPTSWRRSKSTTPAVDG